MQNAVLALAATALVSLLVGIVGFGIGFAAGIWTGPGAFISAVLACTAAAVTVATVSSTLGIGAGAYMFFHTDKKASVAIEKLNLLRDSS